MPLSKNRNPTKNRPKKIKSEAIFYRRRQNCNSQQISTKLIANFKLKSRGLENLKLKKIGVDLRELLADASLTSKICKNLKLISDFGAVKK